MALFFSGPCLMLMHSLEYTSFMKRKIRPVDKQSETIISTKVNSFILVLDLHQEQA